MKMGTRVRIRRNATVLMASLMLAGTILPAVETGYAAEIKAQRTVNSKVTLQFNGKTVQQQQGILMESGTWVPISFFRDAVNLPLKFDAKNNTYSVGQGNRQLNLSIQEGRIISNINGFYINNVEAKIINGHIYIPFQWVRDYLGYEGEWNQAAKQLNVIKIVENKLTVSSVSYDEDTKQASIHLKYPQLSGTGNTELEQSVNETFKKDIDQFRDSIDKQVQKIKAGEDRLPYEFTSNYLITYNQQGVLSLLTEHYEYTGGAHGYTVRKGYTFSLKDGKLLKLEDLFGENPDYLKQLNNKLKAKLKASPDYFGGFEGLREQPDFYLQSGRLKIFFQLYDIMPYSSGFPEFSFPFHELLSKGSSPFKHL